VTVTGVASPPAMVQWLFHPKSCPLMCEAHHLQRVPPGPFRRPTRNQDPDKGPGGARCIQFSPTTWLHMVQSPVSKPSSKNGCMLPQGMAPSTTTSSMFHPHQFMMLSDAP
jgi:hypothetical protein